MLAALHLHRQIQVALRRAGAQGSLKTENLDQSQNYPRFPSDDHVALVHLPSGWSSSERLASAKGQIQTCCLPGTSVETARTESRLKSKTGQLDRALVEMPEVPHHERTPHGQNHMARSSMRVVGLAFLRHPLQSIFVYFTVLRTTLKSLYSVQVKRRCSD
jgi:hypothetical protein